jgi:quinol monooxygenase YgiN
MIHHAVYLSLIETTDLTALAEVMQDLENLVDKIEGFTAFQHGRNVDLEGKSPESPYGFHATFTDRAALARYAHDPRHQALGARLVALCGGPEAIKVYDIETND